MISFRLSGALVAAGIFSALGARPADLSAQEQQTQPSVFIDCQARNCNQQYFRTEIDWVNWVRDQEVADLYLFFTRVPAGGGGQIYQLDFVGQGDAEGYEESIEIPTLPTDTEREELDRIVQGISLALAQFAVAQGYRELVEIRFDGLGVGGGAQDLVSADEVNDPWNLWTFNLSGNVNTDGEDRREDREIRTNFSASRVTPTWKMNFRAGFNGRRIVRERTDEPTFINEQNDWNGSALAIYALAESWSLGLRAETGRVIRANQDFRLEVTPAIEYSFFPYAEANRRSLTAFYAIGPAYRNYIEPTVFGESEEIRWEHAFEVELAQRQRWGETSISASASQFLHDASLYRMNLEGDVDFRVFRGLNIFGNARVSWVQDQIFLAAEGLTSEEELLNLLIQDQTFTWRYNFGVRIRFGSIFNNVVNNRFGPGFWW